MMSKRKAEKVLEEVSRFLEPYVSTLIDFTKRVKKLETSKRQVVLQSVISTMLRFGATTPTEAYGILQMVRLGLDEELKGKSSYVPMRKAHEVGIE